MRLNQYQTLWVIKYNNSWISSANVKHCLFELCTIRAVVVVVVGKTIIFGDYFLLHCTICKYVWKVLVVNSKFIMKSAVSLYVPSNTDYINTNENLHNFSQSEVLILILYARLCHYLSFVVCCYDNVLPRCLLVSDVCWRVALANCWWVLSSLRSPNLLLYRYFRV